MTTATKTNGRTPRVLAASTVQPDGLAAALLAFHAEAPKLKRDATGQIGSRAYGYTSLDSLLDDVEPLLLKHDLLWSAKVTVDAGQPAALYEMKHVPSGESEEWIGPLPCVDPGPQSLGSAITYMRRYTLQAYLNLAPGEDDDGAAASAPQLDKYPNSPQGQPSVNTGSAQPTAAPPKRSERQLSEGQQRLLRARFAEANLDVLTCANIVAVAKGEPAREDADENTAKRWLDREIQRLPARLVDAVLEGIASCPPF